MKKLWMIVALAACTGTTAPPPPPDSFDHWVSTQWIYHYRTPVDSTHSYVEGLDSLRGQLDLALERGGDSAYAKTSTGLLGFFWKRDPFTGDTARSSVLFWGPGTGFYGTYTEDSIAVLHLNSSTFLEYPTAGFHRATNSFEVHAVIPDSQYFDLTIHFIH